MNSIDFTSFNWQAVVTALVFAAAGWIVRHNDWLSRFGFSFANSPSPASPLSPAAAGADSHPLVTALAHVAAQAIANGNMQPIHQAIAAIGSTPSSGKQPAS